MCPDTLQTTLIYIYIYICIYMYIWASSSCVLRAHLRVFSHRTYED